MEPALSLPPDDNRLGTYATDGTVTRWPTVDIFGQTIPKASRRDMVFRHAGRGYFVLVPPARNGEIEGINVAIPPPAPEISTPPTLETPPATESSDHAVHSER